MVYFRGKNPALDHNVLCPIKFALQLNYDRINHALHGISVQLKCLSNLDFTVIRDSLIESQRHSKQ